MLPTPTFVLIWSSLALPSKLGIETGIHTRSAGALKNPFREAKRAFVIAGDYI
jgi:hypothetical protein